MDVVTLGMAKADAKRNYVANNGLKATSYPRTRKKFAGVRAGQGDMKVAIVGDSTSWGYGTGAPVPPLVSWPGVLPGLLADPTMPVAVGMGITVPTNNSDARWNGTGVLPSGWSVENQSNGFSGYCFKASAAASPLTYTPGGGILYDTFDVYYIATGSSAAFTIQATGGTLVTVTPGSTNGVFKATCVAGTAATTNAVTITLASGGRIIGVEPYLSTTSRVRIGNVSTPAVSAVGWANANAYASIPCLKAYAPDLTLICLGINDSYALSNVATFQANMQLVINAAKVSGEVILVSFIPSQDDGTILGDGSKLVVNEAAIAALYKTLAALNGLALIDNYSRLVSGAVGTSMGYFFDLLHYNKLGYWDFAAGVANGLKAI